MSVDLIRYDLLVQDALRAVVRRVLNDVARDGLPGEHHLYISFDTQAPGVRISPRLKEKYPEEMTIVLQHQFWDLIVAEQFFEVGLSFNGIPERLHVAFDALKGFFDPSVKFGLQFEPPNAGEGEDESEDAPAPTGPQLVDLSPVPLNTARPTSVPSTRAPSRSNDRPDAPASVVPAKVDGAAKPAPAKAEVAKAEASKSGTAKADGAKSDGTKADAAKPDAAKSETTKSGAAARAGGAVGDGAAGNNVASKNGAARDEASGEAEIKDATLKDDDSGDDAPKGGAQVVRLDAFRKK